jgi:hypothetical protein
VTSCFRLFRFDGLGFFSRSERHDYSLWRVLVFVYISSLLCLTKKVRKACFVVRKMTRYIGETKALNGRAQL